MINILTFKSFNVSENIGKEILFPILNLLSVSLCSNALGLSDALDFPDKSRIQY